MFVFSFPILFNQIQLGTPLEFMLFFLFLYGVLLISAPYVSATVEVAGKSPVKLTFYQYLRKAWQGELKLWFVFWPFFLFLNASLFTIDSLARQRSLTVSSWDEIHFILLMTVIFWTIAVWRCSRYSSSRFWMAAARLMTLSVFFEYGLKLLIRSDYPRLFFNCQTMVMDYVNCF